MKQKPDMSKVEVIYRQLLNDRQSVILGTVNPDGTPLVSYAPFVVNQQKQFFIFTSQLAAHTANLQRRSPISLMLIDDEESTRQIFARRRLTFHGTVEPLPRHHAEWQPALAQYEERFGNMVGMLKSLPDFQLFKITPHSGQLVVGFGQAYDISGDNLDKLTHRRI